LRSPAADAAQLKFFIEPCGKTLSAAHKDMQRQRLLMEGVAPFCSDSVAIESLASVLANQFRQAVQMQRPFGDDMVLVVGVHREETPEVATAVESAIALVLAPEKNLGTPRLAGAFVFDSFGRSLDVLANVNHILWCPGVVSETSIIDPALACVVIPDFDLSLGPFRIGGLPIFAPRDDYLTFIDRFSRAQEGRMRALTFRVPRRTSVSETLLLEPFGAATFFNDEVVTAPLDAAFSFCPGAGAERIVFRPDGLLTDSVLDDFVEACRQPDAIESPNAPEPDDGGSGPARDAGLTDGGPGGDPGDGLGFGEGQEDLCEIVNQGILPVSLLPEFHDEVGSGTYRLGLLWEFAFLLRVRYEAVASGAVSAFSASVPFGIRVPATQLLGAEIWTNERIDLRERLILCDRFCRFPTFSNAGTYDVRAPFSPTYLEACYDPRPPMLGEGGFPFDP
jgi:hypothetical protein